jgi:hypothetical protein
MFFPQDGQFMVSPIMPGCDMARILETVVSLQEEKNMPVRFNKPDEGRESVPV